MACIRAAARYTRNDERSSKQFLSQFKSRSASKSLNSVSNSTGTIVETPEEISKACQDFYTSLYSKVSNFQSPHEPPPFFSLSEQQPSLESLMFPATMEELAATVKTLPRDKCPGPDGIPYEFYKRNFHCIKESLLALVNI